MSSSNSGTTWIRRKRATILGQITNPKQLDRKSMLDRSLFAGNAVLQNGTVVNTKGPCCKQLDVPAADTCPVIVVGNEALGSCYPLIEDYQHVS